MALFLVKLDPETNDARGDPRFVATVGRVIEVQTDDGGKSYRFLSNTSAHKGSRKAWPTVTACIPAWTEQMGFLRLYDASELEAALAAR
jgi:hypothetical protein